MIQAFGAGWFVPFDLVMLPYPAVQLANTPNQLYWGIQRRLACPRPAPPSDKTRPLKISLAREQGTVFCARRGEFHERAVCVRASRGKCCGRTLRARELFFSSQATILLQGAEMQDTKLLASAWKSARGEEMRAGVFDFRALGSHLLALESHCACVIYVSDVIPYYYMALSH